MEMTGKNSKRVNAKINKTVLSDQERKQTEKWTELPGPIEKEKAI